jgi:hypothetical protein
VGDEMRKLGLVVHLRARARPLLGAWHPHDGIGRLPGQVEGTKPKTFVTALGGNWPAVVVVNNFEELKRVGRAKVTGKIVLFNVIYDHRKAVAGQAGAAYTVRFSASQQAMKSATNRFALRSSYV